MKKNLLVLISLAVLLIPGSGRSADFELLPEAQVDLQGIFLHQLVKTGGAAGVQLASAPAWGETRTLTRDAVIQLISKSMPSSTIVLTGAPEIRISRRSQLLEQKELQDLLTQELQPTDDAVKTGELVLQFSRPWKPISVPADDLQLKIIDRPSSGLAPSLVVRFQLISAGSTIGTYMASLRAQLFRDVWIARSAVRRQTPMSEADLVRERRDVISIRQPLWNGDVDSTLNVVEAISSGGIVYARAIRTRPVLRRGDVVQAIANDGPLSVSIRVEVLDDGAPEDIIRARNPRTKKEFRAKVINEQTIQLIL